MNVTLNPLSLVTSDIVADLLAEKRDHKIMVVTPHKIPDPDIVLSEVDRDILMPRRSTETVASEIVVDVLIPRTVRIKAIFAEGE